MHKLILPFHLYSFAFTDLSEWVLSPQWIKYSANTYWCMPLGPGFHLIAKNLQNANQPSYLNFSWICISTSKTILLLSNKLSLHFQFLLCFIFSKIQRSIQCLCLVCSISYNCWWGGLLNVIEIKRAVPAWFRVYLCSFICISKHVQILREVVTSY